MDGSTNEDETHYSEVIINQTNCAKHVKVPLLRLTDLAIKRLVLHYLLWVPNTKRNFQSSSFFLRNGYFVEQTWMDASWNIPTISFIHIKHLILTVAVYTTVLPPSNQESSLICFPYPYYLLFLPSSHHSYQTIYL